MSTTGPSAPIYFGGPPQHPNPKPTAEWVRSGEAFGHYLMTVWVNEHTVPTEPAALARFNVNDLVPDYRAFFGGGGKIPERGVSLEEMWLGSQLQTRHPITCLLNADQPEQDLTRITRLRRMSAAEIWAELLDLYAKPELKRPLPNMTAGLNPFVTAVYDGDEIAHFITAWTIHGGELHFHDPWPGRSLLCAEHNSAGVAARESDLIRNAWRITRAELERVVFAVYLHTLADTPPRPRVELTDEERRTAEQWQGLREMVRGMNRPGAKPIEGMKRISRVECAVRLKRVWELKVAINEGDDLNERGEDGSTPLHVAAEMGHLESVKLLAEHGADLQARNAKGKTPAEVATSKRKTAVAKYLKSLG